MSESVLPACSEALSQTKDEVLSTCVQIVDGVQHVHDSGYVHSDIKPENCLKGSDGQVKLCDFGGARPVNTGTWGCVALPSTQQAHALLPLQRACRWSKLFAAEGFLDIAVVPLCLCSCKCASAKCRNISLTFPGFN